MTYVVIANSYIGYWMFPFYCFSVIPDLIRDLDVAWLNDGALVIPHSMRDLYVLWLIDAKIPAFAGMRVRSIRHPALDAGS